MKYLTELRIVFSLLFSLLLLSAPAVHAQEDAEAEEQTEAQERPILQGRAAVLLANSLGLYVGQQGTLTAEEAIGLLMAKGISPLGGWKENEPMTPQILARILGQSFQEITVSEEGENDPDAAEYIEELMGIGLDVLNLGDASLRAPSGFNPNDGNPSNREESTVGEPEILVTEAEVIFAISFIPTGGGTGGQVDGGSGNITPSAP